MEALNRYWAAHPPLHIVAAAMAGVKPAERARKDADGNLVNNYDDVMEIASMFSDGVLK